MGHIFKMASTTTLLAALAAATTMVTASASDRKQELLSESDYTSTFNEWTKTHNKKYRGAERDYRYSTFKRNHDLIHKHNADGSKSFKLGHNQFSDMSNDEFKATMMGLAKNPNYGKQGNLKTSIHVDSLSDSVPASVDWRIDFLHCSLDIPVQKLWVRNILKVATPNSNHHATA